MHESTFDSESEGVLGSLGPMGPDPRPLQIVSGLCIRFVLCVSIHLIDCNEGCLL